MKYASYTAGKSLSVSFDGLVSFIANCFDTEVCTVDDGTKVPHVLDIILIRHPDRPYLVQDFLPEACHDLRVHCKQINSECKCRSSSISAG